MTRDVVQCRRIFRTQVVMVAEREELIARLLRVRERRSSYEQKHARARRESSHTRYQHQNRRRSRSALSRQQLCYAPPAQKRLALASITFAGTLL